MRLVYAALNWILGISFIALGVFEFFASPYASLSLLFGSLFLLPPIRDWVSNKTNLELTTGFRSVIVSTFFVVYVVFALIATWDKSAEERRQKAALEAAQADAEKAALVAEFSNNRPQILNQLMLAMAEGRYKTVLDTSLKYADINDTKLNELRTQAQTEIDKKAEAERQARAEIEKARETQSLLKELKTTPPENTGKNFQLYRRLNELNPNVEFYQKQRALYAKKFDEENDPRLIAKGKYVEQIKREIASLPNVNVDKFLDSETTLMLGLAMVSAWAQIAANGKKHNLNNEESALLNKFKTLASEAQTRSLPKLRDSYGPILRKKLWEHDITAKTFGNRFKTIEFVGGVFAANRNIKQWQDTIRNTLHMFRFSQVRYKWYDGADKYTYFDMNGHTDSQLVIWKGDGQYIEVE